MEWLPTGTSKRMSWGPPVAVTENTSPARLLVPRRVAPASAFTVTFAEPVSTAGLPVCVGTAGGVRSTGMVVGGGGGAAAGDDPPVDPHGTSWPFTCV